MHTLPCLYLSILKDFLKNLASTKKLDGYTPELYRKFIYFDLKNPNKKLPLFIYDPLEIIDELITSLSILWSGSHELIRKFKIFRLANYNILQGKEQTSDNWKTLLAYCGGWTENGKCGKNPLVLGNQRHCPECGKLVCDICGFCNNGCPNCYTRKSEDSIPF